MSFSVTFTLITVSLSLASSRVGKKASVKPFLGSSGITKPPTIPLNELFAGTLKGLWEYLVSSKFCIANT